MLTGAADHMRSLCRSLGLWIFNPWHSVIGFLTPVSEEHNNPQTGDRVASCKVAVLDDYRGRRWIGTSGDIVPWFIDEPTLSSFINSKDLPQSTVGWINK